MSRLLPSSLVALFAGLAVLSGCVVHGSDAAGVIDVQWAPATGESCASLGVAEVRLRITRDTVGQVSLIDHVSCPLGSRRVTVDPGTYSVQVEGLAFNGNVVAQTAPVTVNVLAGFTQPTGKQPLSSLQPATSGVAMSWTIQGMAAVAGCTKFGLKDVVVSILDENKSKVLGSRTVACSVGQAQVDGITNGARWIQVDAYDASNKPVFGNEPLYGPFTVQGDSSGKLHAIAQPLDLGPLSTPALKGGVTASWKVNGKAVDPGCDLVGVKTVAVSVLDETKSKVLATKQTACLEGKLQVDGVPAGKVRYLQVDGYAAGGTKPTYGNNPLFGPFEVEGDKLHKIADLIDLVKL